MADDEVDRLTLEWLEIHGTPRQQADFAASIQRRLVVTEDHETRLRSLETGMTEVKSQLRGIAAEAHDTRVEQNAALKTILEDLKAVAKEQEREAGRREGTAIAVAAALRKDDRTDGWVKASLPWILAVLIAAASWFNFQTDMSVRAKMEQGE